jgi:hypothetical protein
MHRSIIVIHCCVHFRKKLKDDIEKKKGYIFRTGSQLNFIPILFLLHSRFFQFKIKSEILAKTQFFDGLRSFSRKDISLHVIRIEMYRSGCDLGPLHTYMCIVNLTFSVHLKTGLSRLICSIISSMLN